METKPNLPTTWIDYLAHLAEWFVDASSNTYANPIVHVTDLRLALHFLVGTANLAQRLDDADELVYA